MSNCLVVTGLPEGVSFSKVLKKLRIYLKHIKVSQFWLRDLTSCDGHYQQVTVEFSNSDDARSAREYLTNVPFPHNMMEHQLQVHTLEEPMYYNEDEFEDWGRKRRQKRPRPRSRSPGYGPSHGPGYGQSQSRYKQRSRSPGYSQQASDLDLEIELLRKQRMVIEEERRLLMEQKKLEMIKEYGPNALREFDKSKDFEPPHKRRQHEPIRPQKPPVIPKPPKTKFQQNKAGALPLFFQPCKILISQMRPIIQKDTSKEEVEILTKLIRAAIRKDLAIALENKEYMKHREIINLYRQRHPKEEDEAFVGKILANIRASYVIPEIKQEIKVEKEDKATEKETDAKDEIKNDKGAEANEEKTEEIPGENKTDAAQNNGVVNTEETKKPDETGPELENEAANENEAADENVEKPVATSEQTEVKNAADADENENEDALLADGDGNEDKPADWVEQWSPQKNDEKPEVSETKEQ